MRKLRNRRVRQAIAVAITMTTVGCSDLNIQEERAITGVAIGAGAGALFGALAGSALIGAAIGAGGGVAFAALSEGDAR